MSVQLLSSVFGLLLQQFTYLFTCLSIVLFGNDFSFVFQEEEELKKLQEELAALEALTAVRSCSAVTLHFKFFFLFLSISILFIFPFAFNLMSYL